jgi:hypothetical protein
METIGIRIGEFTENNKDVYKDTLIGNLVIPVMAMNPIKTTKKEKRQGYGERKIELKVIILLD